MRKIRTQIAELTRNVAETVEKEGGLFGELAVDVCIYNYNTIKILEINSKPGTLFSQVNAYKLRNRAAVRLLNYTTSLAGYELKEH